MACDCSVTRVLLDSESMVIDVGRSRRLIDGALRKALSVRDKHCQWPECERPASWCDGHHLVHWVDGGETRLDNCLLLCKRHHRLVHEGGWQLIKTEGGQLMTVAPTITFGLRRGPDQSRAVSSSVAKPLSRQGDLMSGRLALSVAVAVVATSLASCGSTTHPGGTAASSSTRQASPTATSMPSNQSAPERLAVLYGADSGDTYNLDLLGLDGKVVAKLTPKHQFYPTVSQLAAENFALALLPYSTSAQRLYYLDGFALKYVTPLGDAGTIRTFDASGREYAFAVTPDDSRIAIAEFDRSSNPPRFHLWVENLGGGNRVELRLANITYAWPFSWYGGQLIVVETKGYPFVSTEGPWFFPLPMTAHLIDSATGAEAATLCSWPVAAHALCIARSAGGAFSGLFTDSWDGHRVPQPQVGAAFCYPNGVLSPDGLSIASMDFRRVPSPGPIGGASCIASNAILISDASGRRTELATSGYPEAYFDESHLIYKTDASEYQHYAMNMLDLQTGAHSQIDFMNGSCRQCTAFGVLPPFQS